MISVRKILPFLLILALLIPGLAAAETTRQNEETGFRAVIDDRGGLLDEAEYEGIFETMMPITDYCHAGLYTYSGESKEYVINKAFAWAQATFNEDCTLFIIDMATRQLAVWSTDEIMKTITQAKSYTITDNVYSYASRGEYATCAKTAFNQMYRVLKGEKVTGTMRYISNALLGLLAAILLAYLLISARMEQEIKVTMPDIITATAGAGAVIAGKKLARKVKHSSSSGGGHGGGFHSSGGGFGGGGGFHGGGGSHGF